MVLGHVHEEIGSVDRKSWSIRPFSVDLNRFAYGILERDPTGMLELRLDSLERDVT
jgi:hypothetical protein